MTVNRYEAPVDDMCFVMEAIAGLGHKGEPGCPPELARSILDQAGRFGSDVLAPLNATGDRQGARLENGAVRTPDGFAEAYRQYADTGWNGICGDPTYGGQGLPLLLGTAVAEIWAAANLAFSLGPALTQSAVRLLAAHATADQKKLILPKLVSGEWTATMALTEPQAGSDLSAVRTRAVPDGAGFRVSGQKIFTSYGDHDWAANIIHLVLARLPGAPPGVKGISLFMVPKFLIEPDGTIGGRNDVRCVSLERKLGIHAVPTAVMAFGDGEGAIGQLIGPPHEGLTCMFAMMNAARLAIGLQGVATAERALQLARVHARQRQQGRRPDGTVATIIEHGDVRRMLLAMKAKTEAARTLAYYVAAQVDASGQDADSTTAEACRARVELLTPVVKAWCSDIGIEVADMGIQVHGGAGYIEETGAAQLLRDGRIATIYEGTNGIQARDLVGRKVRRDGGRAARAFIALARQALWATQPTAAEAILARPAERALERLESATNWLTDRATEAEAMAVATPYLRLMGLAAAGWLSAHGSMTAARRGDFAGKVAAARFFADHVGIESDGLARIVMTGAPAILEAAPDDI